MIGVRYLFAAACFLSLITNFAIRVNINVAIVAMVNSTVYHGDNRTASQDCATSNNAMDDVPLNIKQPMEGEFLWTPKTQGIILGAFYYGYCSFQIVAGRLSEIYSGKWVFVIGSFIASLLALITPVAAHFSVLALVCVRALQGVAQGVMLPSLYSMAGHWLPDSERGVFSSLIHSGMNVGIVLGMTATGYLSSTDIFNGWPSAFYVFGLINCLMAIIFSLLITNSPLDHPFMTKKEKKFITSHQEAEMNKYIPPIPWKKVITSKPVWVLLFVQIGAEWFFYILLNQLPTFFATVLHFNLKENGLVSSLPFLFKACVGMVVGFSTDALIRRKLASVNFIRKFGTSVGLLSSAAGLIGVCLAGCDATLCVTFFMISIPMIGFCYVGHTITHLNLSPEYAGTLMGITNSFGSLTGFAAPMFVGFMTNEHQGLKEWHIVFATAIIFSALACIVFVLFGSTENQKWAENKTERTALVESQRYSLLKENDL